MSKRHYSLRSFFSFMRKYKLRFTVTISFFIVANSFLAIMPVFIGKLIGALAAQPIQGHQAVIYLWILIFCSVGHDMTWRLSELVYLKLINPLSYEYENILFKTVIHKPYPYFVDKFTGKISSNVTIISEELRSFFDGLCFNYTSEAVSLVAVIAILTTINLLTVVIFLSALLCMFFVGRFTIKNSAKYEKHSTDIRSTKNGRIIDAIANFVNVKSFHKERAESSTVVHEQTKVISAANKSYFWNTIFWGSLSVFVREIIWPATIGLNVYLFIHHEISVAQLATLLSTILLFSNYIWEIIWYISQFNLKLARIEEAHVYLFGQNNIIEDAVLLEKDAVITPGFTDSLNLNITDFAYPDKPDKIVLKNISVDISKNEKIGIVGKSGSGKTTLTKILLGYYDIGNEQVSIDGIAVDTNDLLGLISYVPQDTSLFHRTIAENIAYAVDQTVSRQEIVEAAKKAHADEFISQLGQDYDTLVGERGVKLSAGQRQRIAIARALLDNKPILILDEATSALDSESESLVQRALETLWEHKTVIAIAHRLSTLKHMDRILVMDAGRIVEHGTHSELLRQKGIYAQLWKHQSGGFLEE